MDKADKPQGRSVHACTKADVPESYRVEQLPKHQTPLKVRDSEHCPDYVEEIYVLVTPEREARLRQFGAELKALCDRWALNLIASPDGDFMEVEERGFRYPEGFNYSASLRNHRKIIIERTWFFEVLRSVDNSSQSGFKATTGSQEKR